MQYPYFKAPTYENFNEMLCGLYEHSKNKTAIEYYQDDSLFKISYEELINEIANVYYYFKRSSVQGKHIAIVSENRYEYIVMYIASLFNNVIVPIDKELTKIQLLKLVEEFDIDKIICTNKTFEKVADCQVDCINLDESYSSMINSGNRIVDFLMETHNTDKDRFAVLVFSSGTNGDMKGIMLSQYNIIINIRGSLENNILKSPTLSILPMNHTFGFSPGVLASLYNSCTLCLNMDIKDLGRDIKRFKPYFIGGVPMIVEGIYDNIEREIIAERKEKSFNRLKSLTKFLLRFGIDIRRNVFDFILPKRLKLIVSGGAELNSKYVEKYKDLGIELLNGYGLTECSPIISVCRQIDNVAGSSGTILNHIDIKIAEDGEILVKGPNVMLGYYKNEELTKSVFEDGYFKTGDLGYKDEKNNKLYVTGRKSNLIILSNGKNVSPEVLEEEIIKFGYVEECLVTTDKSSHKSLIAKVYMDKQHEEEFKHDLDDLNSRNPSYMAIYKYEIMNERFEKNSNKKIKRSLYV